MSRLNDGLPKRSADLIRLVFLETESNKQRERSDTLAECDVAKYCTDRRKMVQEGATRVMPCRTAGISKTLDQGVETVLGDLRLKWFHMRKTILNGPGGSPTDVAQSRSCARSAKATEPVFGSESRSIKQIRFERLAVPRSRDGNPTSTKNHFGILNFPGRSSFGLPVTPTHTPIVYQPEILAEIGLEVNKNGSSFESDFKRVK
ncbi:hypothetical protein DFH94DRAFT_685025 [Russula ochroleuca]|uniref:Uncharacterized protein n=1 Tax=Russula ochroleuca TaxID=152965 RepID=A0A9P5MP81_9AGAM|nr:hypothetical protein DFH94DRAFT_685025 [Russula ochroleuca]